MGRPKLLLPLGEKTVIARLLETLDRPGIRCRAVVHRQDDRDLSAEVEKSGAWAIGPETDPPEMRESVQAGLSAIAEKFSPAKNAGWLLVPADHPVLSTQVIDRLIEAWQKTSAEILVPAWQNSRGHPTIFLAARGAAPKSRRIAAELAVRSSGSSLELRWMIRDFYRSGHHRRLRSP